MIVIEDNQVNAIYCRTNRRTRWQYSEYGGRYTTKNEAIEKAKEHYGKIPFEYLIENMETGEETTGFIKGE